MGKPESCGSGFLYLFPSYEEGTKGGYFKSTIFLAIVCVLR
jgi:hypothetical protein